jgi:hypothetical protein
MGCSDYNSMNNSPNGLIILCQTATKLCFALMIILTGIMACDLTCIKSGTTHTPSVFGQQL